MTRKDERSAALVVATNTSKGQGETGAGSCASIRAKGKAGAALVVLSIPEPVPCDDSSDHSRRFVCRFLLVSCQAMFFLLPVAPRARLG